MMSKEAADGMNNMTLGELQGLYVQGLITIIGNGQVVCVVPADMAEHAEKQRCREGY